MQEQEAKTKGEGEYESDGHVPLCQTLANEAHADSRSQGHQHQSPEGSNANKDRTRCTGKADMRQSVPRECLTPQYQKVTDHTRDDGDNSCCLEGSLHEIIIKHRSC